MERAYYVDLLNANYSINLQVYRPETNDEMCWVIARNGKILKEFASFSDAQKWVRKSIEEKEEAEERGYVLKYICSVFEVMEAINW